MFNIVCPVMLVAVCIIRYTIILYPTAKHRFFWLLRYMRVAFYMNKLHKDKSIL